MDFEGAAERLAKDQSKIRANARRKGGVLSAKAQREAEFRRKQQARLRAQRQEQQKQLDYQRSYFTNIERTMLQVKSLGSRDNAGGDSSVLRLKPTSIWGDGDKVALPPSVLERLTAADSTAVTRNGAGNPWIFRIGIPNPEYSFPASSMLATLKAPNDEDVNDMEDGDDDSGTRQSVYLDEIAHKYLAYTFCTVVEFTQDEGYVGIPQPIANALLDPTRRRPEDRDKQIPSTRTVDPARAAAAVNRKNETSDDRSVKGMEVDMTDDNDDRTPGHLAYGAFDVPDVELEVSMVRLPKGRKCTLTPTPDAVRNNFYGLKDIKLVLEQSLIRTRATLAVHDVVHAWHRGIKYDMTVDKVTPSAFDAVLCINTDIEVDIGETSMPDAKPEPVSTASATTTERAATNSGMRLGSGQTLGSSQVLTGAAAAGTTASTAQSHTAAIALPPSPLSDGTLLPPEPPKDQEGVCTIQLRSSSGTGRRRFDVQLATLRTLFDFALATTKTGSDPTSIQLVTRFPRRVLVLDGSNDDRTLADLGIAPGQEMFMVESR